MGARGSVYFTKILNYVDWSENRLNHPFFLKTILHYVCRFDVILQRKSIQAVASSLANLWYVSELTILVLILSALKGLFTKWVLPQVSFQVALASVMFWIAGMEIVGLLDLLNLSLSAEIWRDYMIRFCFCGIITKVMDLWNENIYISWNNCWFLILQRCW